MYTLSGRWHAAALLSGKLDLSQPVQQRPGEVGRLSADQLEALGIRAAHAIKWRGGQNLVSPFPFLTLDDSAYPDLLRPVPFAPPVLFWEGNPDLLQAGPKVAIVGARRCTGDGKRMARSLARSVADSGGVVVSGMAHGIDTAAHLAAPGRTIAVLGQGLRVPRSRTAGRTATQILSSGGLLISEFVPDYPASRHTFPRRNRVISGLSRFTVVVEAARRSGASITARLALDAGRDVGAVPGSPYAPASAGCLRLLSEGAALIRGPEDLLHHLGITMPAQGTQSTAPEDPIYSAIDPSGTPFDLLVERLEISPSELGAALGALELQGRIRRLPDDRFIPATSCAADPCAWAPSPGCE